MTLEDELSRRRESLRKGLPPGDLEVLRAAVDRLHMLQVVEHGLAVGDQLPEFALPDPDGNIVASEELIARGPLAVVFIRGPWCPYCSLTLAALDALGPAVEELGGSLVVISPVHARELGRAAAERGLRLRLLSDPGAAYARLCGVQFEMSEAHVELYTRIGWDVAQLNAGSGWELPVPASYVVGRDGVIAFAFANADWSHRAEPADILAALARAAQAATSAG